MHGRVRPGVCQSQRRGPSLAGKGVRDGKGARRVRVRDVRRGVCPEKQYAAAPGAVRAIVVDLEACGKPSYKTEYAGRTYVFSVCMEPVVSSAAELIHDEHHRHVARTEWMPVRRSGVELADSCWVREHVFYWGKHAARDGAPTILPLTRGRVSFGIEERNTHTGEAHLQQSGSAQIADLLWLLLSQTAH